MLQDCTIHYLLFYRTRVADNILWNVKYGEKTFNPKNIIGSAVSMGFFGESLMMCIAQPDFEMNVRIITKLHPTVVLP